MALLKILAVVAALSCSSAAYAHHPFDAEFDRNKPQTITGTITKVEWQSPHVYAYVDAKDANGRVTNWKVELGSPDALTKEGWTRTSVKFGDQVTIQGFRARNNQMLLNAESFTLPDGKSVSAASSMQNTAATDRQNARNESAEPQAIGTSGSQTTDTRPADSAPSRQSEALPSTASPLFLYGLGGLLALGGALGLRRARR